MAFKASNMNQSRKRMRSDDADYGVQMKYFVSQQIIEKNDKNLMNGIYGNFNAKKYFENQLNNCSLI